MNIVVPFQDRAKVISRRRPQSRKARRTAALTSSISFEDTSSPTSPDLPPINDLESSQSKTTDVLSNDDLFAGGSHAKPSVPSAVSSQPADDLFSKGLFESSSKHSKPLPEKTSIKEEDDDLFSPSSSKSKQAKSVDIFDDHDSVPAPAKRSNETLSKDDDEDDLFSSSSVSKKDSKPSTSENSTVSSSVSSTASSTSKGKAAAAAEDDIFADSSLNKKKGIW